MTFQYKIIYQAFEAYEETYDESLIEAAVEIGGKVVINGGTIGDENAVFTRPDDDETLSRHIRVKDIEVNGGNIVNTALTNMDVERAYPGNGSIVINGGNIDIAYGAYSLWGPNGFIQSQSLTINGGMINTVDIWTRGSLTVNDTADITCEDIYAVGMFEMNGGSVTTAECSLGCPMVMTGGAFSATTQLFAYVSDGGAVFLCGAAAALLDETIQLFAADRAGQIQDVWIDLGGFCTGVLICALIHRRRRHKKAECGA